MRFLIVTGMSGSGKSHALRFLEDIGYFCADNIPPILIPKFAELFYSTSIEFNKVALGVDIRGGKNLDDVAAVLEDLRQRGYSYEILFLDAKDSVLMNRFKETRRHHPLSKTDPVNVSIAKEREILSDLRKRADYIIDTSEMLTRQLKERMVEILVADANYQNLTITVISFGYKYGLPQECDLAFDVRFIPNPFYFPEMRHQTGKDAQVFDYVMSHSETTDFIEKLMDLLEFLIPNYIKEGKNSLVIGIGCTGGKHRSVAIAEVVNKRLKEDGNFTIVNHRDVTREIKDI